MSREEVMLDSKSTDLSKEVIDGIRLGMPFNSINHSKHFVPHPDNKQYTSSRNFDQYWNEHVIISADRKTSVILQVGILDDNNHSSTAKGINNEMPIKKVISTYGRNYYKYDDKDQSIHQIGYVDLQHNIELIFTYSNGKVKTFNFKYAFDRLKWIE
ncbi:hypothetical protein ABWK22_23510 [Gottfriedia acidiceleris]|uniref:hypothetical protein n=1 Tax=Bacillaceae TaxID=186817 RepID=UPI001145F915|nr:hypothetical protein [Bacillus sp. AFS001701]